MADGSVVKESPADISQLLETIKEPQRNQEAQQQELQKMALERDAQKKELQKLKKQNSDLQQRQRPIEKRLDDITIPDDEETSEDTSSTKSRRYRRGGGKRRAAWYAARTSMETAIRGEASAAAVPSDPINPGKEETGEMPVAKKQRVADDNETSDRGGKSEPG